jgi:hypothetical protein
MSAAADKISGLQFSIESPAEGAVVERDVQVAGWCLAPQGAARAIRVCAADRTLELPVESLRPDVAAAYPSVVRSAVSGFSASLTLAPGSYDLAIEARFDDGDWQSLGSRSIVSAERRARARYATGLGAARNGAFFRLVRPPAATYRRLAPGGRRRARCMPVRARTSRRGRGSRRAGCGTLGVRGQHRRESRRMADPTRCRARQRHRSGARLAATAARASTAIADPRPRFLEVPVRVAALRLQARQDLDQG